MTRSRSFASLAVAAGMVAAASGTVAAADPPGRGASEAHLGGALVEVAGSSGSPLPTEQISFIILRSVDPDQPGTSPGGGDTAP